MEAGVPFIEVYLANWDSHFRDVAAQTRTLMSQVDAGMSALVRDLDDRASSIRRSSSGWASSAARRTSTPAATVCKLLGIDYTREVVANNRPIRVVEQGEQLIAELLG